MGTLVPFDDYAPPTLLPRDDPYAPVAVDAQLPPVTPAVIMAQNRRLASATLRVSQLQKRHEVVGQENAVLRAELLESQEMERELSNKLSTIDQGMDWMLDEVADLHDKADQLAAKAVERGALAPWPLDDLSRVACASCTPCARLPARPPARPPSRPHVSYLLPSSLGPLAADLLEVITGLRKTLKKNRIPIPPQLLVDASVFVEPPEVHAAHAAQRIALF